MKQKIVVFSSHRHFESGGVGTHLKVLNSELIKSNKDFEFILGLDTRQIIKIKIVNLFNRFLFNSHDIIYNSLYIIELKEKLKKKILKYDDYDKIVIHTHDKYTAIASYLCKDLFTDKIEIIQTLHAPFTDQFRTAIKPNDSLINFSELLDTGMTLKLDKIIAVDSLQKKISNDLLIYKDKTIECIPNAVNTDFLDSIEFFTTNEVEFKKFFIIARHLHSKNGVIYAVQAFHKLFNESDYYDDFKVLILGEGGERENIENYINSNKLKEKIILLGAKSNVETVKLIKGAYLSLIPSIPIGNYIEATSLTMLESMYLETPVLASNIGGLAEVIVDKFNGFLFEPTDIEGLCNQLKFIASSKDVYERVVSNGKKTITDKYSSTLWFSKIEKMYI